MNHYNFSPFLYDIQHNNCSIKHYAETKLLLIFYFFISITGQRSQLFVTTYFPTL